MTLQSPRIYIYKITFEEVPYYYYGVHKETKYNEYYMGSPVTYKWVWDFYTPKKQILQLFDFTDEGWLEAQEVEKRLIKPFYNTDKWCLNKNCGGIFTLDVCRKNGEKSGLKTHKEKTGIHSQTLNEKIEIGRIGGKIGGKLGGQKTYELGIGIHKLENQIKGGKISAKKLNSQVWECTVTRHRTTPGPLTKYQKSRGIDTSNRIRIS